MRIKGAGGKEYGLWMMVVGSIGGIANGLFGYFYPDNGIHGSWGMLGVLCASVLIAIASILLAGFVVKWLWLRVLLLVLLFPAIVGTAFCSFMLELNSLVGLMAFALLGWCIHIFIPSGLFARPVGSGSGVL